MEDNINAKEKLSILFVFKLGEPGHVYILFEIVKKGKQIKEREWKDHVLSKAKWNGIQRRVKKITLLLCYQETHQLQVNVCPSYTFIRHHGSFHHDVMYI